MTGAGAARDGGDGGDGRSVAGVRISRLLEDTRRLLPHRPVPSELPGLIARGALIVDIRPVEQRSRDGEIAGAVVIDRNVLEWRLDPTSPDRIPEASDSDAEIVLMCNEGYASSLAAATLQRLGLRNATDLDGGYQAVLSWGGVSGVDGVGVSGCGGGGVGVGVGGVGVGVSEVAVPGEPGEPGEGGATGAGGATPGR